ncbi:hypothetical protein KI387_009480, partial [Taxus chinensis]
MVVFHEFTVRNTQTGLSDQEVKFVRDLRIAMAAVQVSTTPAEVIAQPPQVIAAEEVPKEEAAAPIIVVEK